MWMKLVTLETITLFKSINDCNALAGFTLPFTVLFVRPVTLCVSNKDYDYDYVKISYF